jgi:hypothetical protein
LNVGSDVVWSTIGVAGGKIHVLGTCFRAIAKVRMHGCDLASICVHTSCRLAGLDVTPHHRSHVALVVHKASVEVRGIIRVGRVDMSETTGKGILQEVEHGEEFPRRHIEVVTEPSEVC